MSDKTLFNQDLTLNSLTVNNSIDSNASGYVAQSTTVNPDKITSPQLAVDLLGIFSTTSPNPPVLSSSNNNLIVDLYGTALMQVNGTGGVYAGAIKSGNTVTIQNGFGNPNDVVLSCPQNNVLNVAGSVITTNVEILSSTGNVNLTAPAGSTLQVGGNVQAEALAGTALILQNGVNSTTLSQSSTANNTLVVAGDLQVGNSITLPENQYAFVSSPVFTGGLISCVYTPATPVACLPGLYTAINCNIQNVPTNININTCAFFFQLQSPNSFNGCVPVCVPAYQATRNGTTISLSIAVSNAPCASGATINSVSIFIVNPSYGANAP